MNNKQKKELLAQFPIGSKILIKKSTEPVIADNSIGIVKHIDDLPQIHVDINGMYIGISKEYGDEFIRI